MITKHPARTQKGIVLCSLPVLEQTWISTSSVSLWYFIALQLMILFRILWQAWLPVLRLKKPCRKASVKLNLFNEYMQNYQNPVPAPLVITVYVLMMKWLDTLSIVTSMIPMHVNGKMVVLDGILSIWFDWLEPFVRKELSGPIMIPEHLVSG